MKKMRIFNPGVLKAVMMIASVAIVALGPGAVRGQAPGPFAYVANRFSDDASVIDTSANAVVATVAVGDLPAGIAVSLDGSRVYVSNFVDNTVSVIDTSANTVVATVLVGAGPNSTAVTPDGTRLCVPNGSSDNGSVVNATTNSVVATVPVGDDPRNLALGYGEATSAEWAVTCVPHRQLQIGSVFHQEL